MKLEKVSSLGSSLKNEYFEEDDKTEMEHDKNKIEHKTSRRHLAYVCKVCDKSFKLKGNLNVHIRSVHE